VCEGLSDILTISALVSENILFVLLENILTRMDDKLKKMEVVEEYCESKPRFPSQLFMLVDECSEDGLELYQLCRWVVCIYRVACLDKLDAQTKQLLDRFYLYNYIHILLTALQE
jgi:hypothetical protein